MSDLTPVTTDHPKAVETNPAAPQESLTELIKQVSPLVEPVLKSLRAHTLISTVCETIRLVCIIGFAAGVLFFVYKVQASGNDALAEKTIIGLFGFLGGFLAAKKTSE